MLFWILTAIAFSIKSFQGGVYAWLEPRLGVGWSYVIDQGIPLFVALLATIVVVQRLHLRVRSLIVNHRFSLSVLLFALILAHGWILRYYFFAEDSTSILSQITNNQLGPWHPTINGYPFASFVASYFLFQTNAWAYNIVSLVWFAVASIGLYFFVFLWSRKKSLALLSALYFVTTPTFLDVFSWQANAQGIPLVLGLHIASFICVLLYKKTKQWAYLFLSVLFFAAAVKMGFVRIAGLVLPLLFLLWIPMKEKRSWVLAMGESLIFVVVWMGFVVTRLVPGGLLTLLRYSATARTPEFRFAGYLPKLAFYVAHLSFPSTLARFVFPQMKNLIASMGFHVQSIVFVIGISALVLLGIVGLLALLTGKKRVRPWLALFAVVTIFGSMVYVPLYISVTADLALFDMYFTRMVPPYGPGSRYVFPAEIGAGILFALAVVWLWEKRGWLRRFAVILVSIILIGNTILSSRGHRIIIKSVSEPERSLIAKFFTLVPRDGKPKVVYSANPARNVIDNNVTGWHWLFGFYRYHELTYSNDAREVRDLLKTGKYGREQLFAFYTNPETSSFADLTQVARNEFFNTEGVKRAVPVSFISDASQTDFSDVEKKGTLFIGTRPLLISNALNERIISPKTLRLEMGFEHMADVPVPFADAIVLSRGRELPQQFWLALRGSAPMTVGKLQEIPSSLELLSFKDGSFAEVSVSDRLNLARMIGAMDEQRRGTRVGVSNMYTGDRRVSAEALVDGLFASDPTPSSEDAFYRAESTPTEIIFRLPYPVVLGRVLFNTPKSMINGRSPVEATVFASLGAGTSVAVGSLNDEVENAWSPNNGRLRIIPTKQFAADTVKIVVSKTTNEPVVFDEIIIEPVENLSYSPSQILDLAERNWWYVGGRDVLAALSVLPRYRTLTVAWACAEDRDWERQSKDKKALVGGVWNFRSVPIPSIGNAVSLAAAIDCAGSVLRQVVLVGPAIPTRMKVITAEVQ